MSEFNSDVLTDTTVRPLGGSPASPGDLDKLKNAAGAIGYPLLASEILGSGVFSVTWDQLATVGAGTTTVLSYDVRFPVILHGVSFVNTAAHGATADVKVDGATVLDAPEDIAAGTLVEPKPESGDEEVDRGSTITIELIADGAHAIATPRVNMTLQRR